MPPSGEGRAAAPPLLPPVAARPQVYAYGLKQLEMQLRLINGTLPATVAPARRQLHSAASKARCVSDACFERQERLARSRPVRRGEELAEDMVLDSAVER